jgi:DNA-binding MarR family transcriptional regulator
LFYLQLFLMTERIKQQCDLLPFGGLTGSITKYYYGALSKMFENLDIERYFTVMVVIDRTQEKCTQQYLSDFLNVDKVTMVRILDYLVKKGMIKRVVNKEDRREHLVQLTKKGITTIPQIHEGICKLNKIALKGFSEIDQKQLWKFIEHILNNLQHLSINQVDIKIKKTSKK